ncbi:asparagine synthase [Kiloniella litopenaei]|uniref:asparagine synthase (glutamine-hydrolyzing) n=1 Tax=Kiloniella litopenaei TaxID=1549748 RepID=A0A0M2RBM5_9PROT|nr:asparagine synthase (glutamine-hydrolyzing) [Kiloniella litopenaei]KKJ77018.1 asparagine synthase [Kiloniella litopenaei]
MCGLAGVLNSNSEPASVIRLQAMTNAIAHRGPDGEGHFIDGPLGLGHRRLAIIDLSPAGHQPMETSDGRYVIAYNGEVYNFQELRQELEAQGRQFHSRTDSEVVLNAYAEWGAKALNKLNGMFAFAIWDRKERQLFLARDRYGIKPLYYTLTNGLFAFASEIKALFAHPDIKPRMDKKGLLEYLTFQNFFTDRTLFSDIQLLPAGTYMAVDESHAFKTTRYWDYSFTEPESPANEQEYIEELSRLFSQAVSRQLVSDVEVGAYLSGGMDSGSVTALAAQELPYIRTFTTGFDLNSVSGIELGFDERAKAEHMSYLLKTEHYEMVLKAGDMERIMPQLAYHMEEPRVGQSYPNYYAAKLASKFGKVVLSGTGGDELFAGYPWRYYRAVVNDDFDHYIDKYYSFWQRLIPNQDIKRVFKPIANDVEDVWTRDIFKSVFVEHADQLTRPEDYINHSLYFEAKTFMHGLLVVEDKLSMAHGLETRVPFLDNDLVDFAMKVPVSLKLGNLGEVVRLNENDAGRKTQQYFQKTKDGKLLLRKAMKRYIPSEVTEREKQGFSAPDASWFRGESIDYVRNRIIRNDAYIYNYLDREAVQNLVEDHLQGKANRRLLIWSLLSIEEMLNTFPMK